MSAEASGNDGRSAKLKISWLTLRFANAETERRFAAHHILRAVPVIRLFLLAASISYMAFGVLDWFIIPDQLWTAWLIRYTIVGPIFIAVILTSYSAFFVRIAQPLMALCMASAGIGIVAMTVVAAAPGNALYYAGLIMVMIFGSSLGRLRWIYAGAISILLTALYNAGALWYNPLPSKLLLNNDFFLCTSIGVAVFTGYMQEFLVRKDFASTEMLRDEKARSDYLLNEAQAANKAKGDFLAVVSHELRTPLNAILGFAEVMQRRLFGPVGSERYVSYVDDIHHAAGHLLSIITDILDLSKAEVGKLTLHEESLSLVHVLDQCCRILREKAAEGGLRLVFDLPAAEPVLRADSRLVKQVFLNLIGNAVKFTPAGGMVTLSVNQDEDGAWSVRVADTGIGIAEADLPRVLEPFVQVESAFARKHGGTGLGLPLAKKVMELHGGTLGVESTLGAGTSVTVRFPAARSAASSIVSVA